MQRLPRLHRERGADFRHHDERALEQRRIVSLSRQVIGLSGAAKLTVVLVSSESRIDMLMSARG